jgi:hypothetical protein
VLVVGAAGVATRGQDDRVAVDSGARGTWTLDVPPPGELRPDVLGDGTPVFVVHQRSGRIDVFLAVSTHTPFGLRQLLGWCPASLAFEDLAHGSSWDRGGRKLSGPAPVDLHRFEVVATDGDRLEVGDLREATGRSTGQPELPDGHGTPCLGGSDRETLVLPEVGEPTTLAAVLDAPHGGLVLVEGASIVLRAGGGASACDGRPDDLDECDDVPVRGVEAPVGQGDVVVVSGAFLARVQAGVLLEPVFTRGWTITPNLDAECPPLFGSPLAVGSHLVTVVPDGFTPDGPVEAQQRGEVDGGGESTAVLRLVHDDGRRIEVVSFGSESPPAFVDEAHDGAATEEVTFSRCLPEADGPSSVAWTATVSSTPDRAVLGSQEWEYGGFLVVGGPGVSVEELVEVATGLRLGH